MESVRDRRHLPSECRYPTRVGYLPLPLSRAYGKCKTVTAGEGGGLPLPSLRVLTLHPEPCTRNLEP